MDPTQWPSVAQRCLSAPTYPTTSARGGLSTRAMPLRPLRVESHERDLAIASCLFGRPPNSCSAQERPAQGRANGVKRLSWQENQNRGPVVASIPRARILCWGSGHCTQCLVCPRSAKRRQSAPEGVVALTPTFPSWCGGAAVAHRRGSLGARLGASTARGPLLLQRTVVTASVISPETGRLLPGRCCSTCRSGCNARVARAK